jgi:hypothetical protein
VERRALRHRHPSAARRWAHGDTIVVQTTSEQKSDDTAADGTKRAAASGLSTMGQAVNRPLQIAHRASRDWPISSPHRARRLTWQGLACPERSVPERDKVVRSQIRSQQLQFNLPPGSFFYPPRCTPLLSQSAILQSFAPSLPTGTFAFCFPWLSCIRDVRPRELPAAYRHVLTAIAGTPPPS